VKTGQNAGGRPPYEPTDKERAQVRMLSGMGIPMTDIAKVIGISVPTLATHFRSDLDLGFIEANTKVAASLFKAATDATKPSVVAQIFWLKCRAGWSETEGVVPEETPGKKAQAQAQAKTAHLGTDWDGILPGASAPVQ
jgi:hypothetical protein